MATVVGNFVYGPIDNDWTLDDADIESDDADEFTYAAGPRRILVDGAGFWGGIPADSQQRRVGRQDDRSYYGLTSRHERTFRLPP